MTSVRQPAVAGAFYPGGATELDATIQRYLAAAPISAEPTPKAIIAPHAGYIYSGPVAASVYVRIKPLAGTVSRVALLGPCHRTLVRGLALPSVSAFATPLGDVPIDLDACQDILKLPQVQVFDAPHAQEHSLEVHLPFLQVVLGDFSLVPLAVGDASADEVAEVIDRLWGGPETLVVVSTDLSHFLDYDAAQRLDAVTCRAIENLDPESIGREQACGRVPVKGLLKLAKSRGLKVSTVDFCNSGDTAGDKSRVVGYGSWAFCEEVGTEEAAPKKASGEDGFAAGTQALLDNHGAALLRLAAASIKHGLAHKRALPIKADDYPETLRRRGACFVTLKRGGRLRGCIGSPEARRALVEDVAQNAFSAAFGDPRFDNLKFDELDDLDLSISVLSVQTPINFTGEDDLLSQLRPGVDGLVIEDKGKRALFLPSVWEQLAQPKKFIGHLKAKAGLTANHWSDGFKAWRFIAREVKADSSIWGELKSLSE